MWKYFEGGNDDLLGGAVRRGKPALRFGADGAWPTSGCWCARTDVLVASSYWATGAPTAVACRWPSRCAR